MRQPYHDILDTMTGLLRDFHYAYYNDEHAEPHPKCTTWEAGIDLTNDEISVAPTDSWTCRCVAVPRWWDEYGVPRFLAHTPLGCPEIGAGEVALLRISCQACAREFDVQKSWSRMSALRALASLQTKLGRNMDERFVEAMNADSVSDAVGRTSLSFQIASGTGPSYGDPPFHDCPSGNTMNAWNLRVLEFWRRVDHPDATAPHGRRRGYARAHELEIELPDTANPERIREVAP